MEALPSYLMRLAASHGVSPSQLLQYILERTISDGSISFQLLLWQPICGLVRPTKATELVLGVLSEVDSERPAVLRSSTFIHLSQALEPSVGAYTKRLRWCPACLHDQQLNDGVSYLKLSWFLQDVKACDVHRMQLRERCPLCELLPRPWRLWPSTAECQRCGGRLDVVDRNDIAQIDPQTAAPDLLCLVEEIANRLDAFPPGAANQYVNHVFDKAWASGRELELWKKLPRDDCLRYSSPDEPLTLPIARRIAYLLEIPISELLAGETPAIHSFAFAAGQDPPQLLQPKIRGKTVDREALARTLHSFLHRSGAPISAQRISEMIGVSLRVMRYHCPTLVKRIAAERKAYVAAERRRKRAAAVQAVLEGIATLHA
jgi:hypothetical protein